MVGQKPPLPGVYPLFRFATGLATILLIFSFAANYALPSLSRMASAPVAYGVGGGGGGGDAEEPEMAMEAAPAEEPAEEPMAEAPAAAPAEGQATEEPAEIPPAADALSPTESSPEKSEARGEPTPELAAKTGEQDQVPAGTEAASESELPEPREVGKIIPASWQIALGVLIFANIVILLAMRKIAAAKWQNPK